MGNNEMMLGVDGTLNIVPDHPAASPTCGHRAGIGISQRYLLVFSLHHQGVQTVQALNLRTQRRNLLVKPGALGFRHRFRYSSFLPGGSQMINFDYDLDEIVQVDGIGLVTLRKALAHMPEKVGPLGVLTADCGALFLHPIWPGGRIERLDQPKTGGELLDSPGFEVPPQMQRVSVEELVVQELPAAYLHRTLGLAVPCGRRKHWHRSWCRWGLLTRA
jgi:hypothetical protein